MKIGIRSKLILAISILIIVLFSALAYLFINEKKQELANDIYSNTLAFARLTAPKIVDNYDLYLAENSFVYFNRELKEIFEQNDDIASISIVSYSGEILYDSKIDSEQKYQGEKRMVNENFLKEIQSENIAVKTAENNLVFIKTGEENGYEFVDEKENVTKSLQSGTLVNYFVVPATERYSVVYYLSYDNLNRQVELMVERIIYLAIFGILLGMILSFVLSAEVTKPVEELVEGAGKIAKGNFQTRVNIKTGDEISFLGEAFNKMAQDLQSSIDARVYRERVTHELELAKQIQNQILPSNIPKIVGLDIAAGLLPASEIGGDIYDFLKLTEDRLLMYIGDVTGHGVPAGIVGSVANALFYSYAMEGDLKKILVNVNNVLKMKTMKTMFMTLCLMHWDSSTNKFLYINAGHEKLIHYKRATGEVELEKGGGVAMGMMPDISAHIFVQEIDLHPGDLLIAYSDGFPEARRNKEEQYGIARLKEAVKKNANLGAAELIKGAIFKDVKDFSFGYEQLDDMTLIVIRKN